MFFDIVGYSKLLADDQKELVQELNQIVRETEQFRAADQRLENLPRAKFAILAGGNRITTTSGTSERWVKPKKEASRLIMFGKFIRR